MTGEPIRLAYITAGGLDEARKLAEELVANRLAACVNMVEGMRSVFMWEGALQEDSEVILIAKTTRARFAELTAFVDAHHSYDCPCVLGIPVDAGHAPFMQWIAEQVDAGPA